MASSSVITKSPVTPFKGLESKKSNSWWWDSHVGRNAKWLAENLEDMDQRYKHMLKLIEGDGDSLAKKADMYYRKRPELLSHVEEFYRMYKALAERYELLTGEVRKNIPADLQSQGSISSDISTDVISGWSPHESKMSYRKSGLRAPGFDFFLGPKKTNNDRSTKGDETPSLSDSETEFSESDVSSLYSYSGITVTTGEEELQVRPLESDADSFEVRVEKLQEHQNGSMRQISNGSFDDVHHRIEDYEEQLKIAMEKIQLSEEEIANLKNELQKYELNDDNEDEVHGSDTNVELDVSQPEEKIRALSEELRITKRRVQVLDKEVTQLRKENKDSSDNIKKMQDLLKLAQKEAATWKAKIESEKRQVVKLQDRISRYKASLADRENEVRDLKEVISDANRKYQLHAEISRLTDEKTSLEEKLREWEMQCHSLETQYGTLERTLNDEIEHLKGDIAEKTQKFEILSSDLDSYKQKYEILSGVKDELEAKLIIKNDQISEMEKNLKHLGAEKEETGRILQHLREELEREQVLVLETAEGKLEAIRQLCFTIEHYREGYQQLCQALTEHKQFRVHAS